MKGPIEVEIFGQPFTLTSDDEEEDVREVAAYVDQKMQQVATTTKTVATLRVAILAALNIADEYHKARRREEEMCRQVDSLLASLLGKLSQTEGELHPFPSDELSEALVSERSERSVRSMQKRELEVDGEASSSEDAIPAKRAPSPV